MPLRLIRFLAVFSTAAAAALLFLPRGASAATIHLKNGRTVIGAIDQAGSDDTRVLIRSLSGTFPVPRANILRISEDESTVNEAAGDAAVAAGDLDGALKHYRTARREDPANTKLASKMEIVSQRILERDEKTFGGSFRTIEKLIADGHYQPAIDMCRAQLSRARNQPSVAERLGKLTARAHLGLARQFKDRVEYPRAEEQYRNAIKADPADPASCFELGDLLRQAFARKSESLPLYLTGLELAAENPSAFDERKLLAYRHLVAELHSQAGDHALAADEFLAIAGSPHAADFPAALDEAAEAYGRIPGVASSADAPRIVENLEKILAARPGNKRASLLAAKILIAQGDADKARNVLAASVKANGLSSGDPVMQESFYHLGVLRHRLGDLVGAGEVLQLLADARLASYDAICELAEIRFAQADYQKALDLFSQARSADRDRYRAYMGMGDCMATMERYADARENYQEVIARDQRNFRVRLEIAKTYLKEVALQETLAASQEAIDSLRSPEAEAAAAGAPGFDRKALLAEAYSVNGSANLALNSNNRAREQFEHALELRPAFAPALEGLGKSYQAENRQAEAQKYFDLAIDADPRNPDYRLSRAINYHKFQKNTVKALPEYLAYLELGGTDPNVHQWIADCRGGLALKP